MGVFAVLKTDDALADVAVEALHINLWCLPVVVAHRLVCDVGLVIRAPVPPALELWLPFEPDAAAEDLHNALLVPETAALVFNEPVTVSGNVLELDESRQRMALLHADPGRPERSGAIWTIKVELAAPATEDLYYARVRFALHAPGTTWTWRREGGLLRHYGALLDLRVNDLRDLGASIARQHEDRLAEIRQVNLFAVVPWRLQLWEASPPLRRSRVLEAAAWNDYLGRRYRMTGTSTRALVHYWRQDPDDNASRRDTPRRDQAERAVTLGQPFAAFARFGRGTAMSLGEFALLAMGAAALILPFAELSHAGENVRGWAADGIGWVDDVYRWLVVAGVLGGGIGVGWRRRWRWAIAARRTARRALWRIAKAVY